MNQPTTLLFDLDGTLLDTAPEFAFCLNLLLAQENKNPISEAELRPHISLGAKGMCKFVFGASTESKLFQSYIDRFLNLYEQHLGQKTKLFEGIAYLLDYLAQQGIPWGIVTNKTSRYAKPLIERFPELSQTNVLVCGDTVDESKPSAKPLLFALKALQRLPKDSWYVGDARTDVEASKNANMQSVVATYGYIPPNQDLLTWHADHYIDKPTAIIDLLDRCKS